ncbi:MAG: hypothetical protein OXG71_01230, partial [Rhodospirillales bacterium]|nr:hypothetical protein [Rhodospirillales bacterium]
MYIVFSQLRVSAEQVSHGRAFTKLAEYHLHRDPGASDHGLTQHHSSFGLYTVCLHGRMLPTQTCFL